MTISKTIITITVLHDSVDDLDFIELGQIIDAMNEGDMIGMSKITSTEHVAPEKVRDELLAVGNDGTFFDAIDFDAIDEDEDK